MGIRVKFSLRLLRAKAQGGRTRPVSETENLQNSSSGELEAAPGVTLAGALRGHLPHKSWRQVRELCASGKVMVNGARVIDSTLRMAGGEKVVWNMAKPDPRRQIDRPGFRIVHEDGHLVVIEKPEGVSTVPYERKESGTALDLIREAWRRQGKRATATPLYIVHRIDKDTSGLVCFAKTKLAERGLHHVFKQHLAAREYTAVAHGRVRGGRIESRLIADRGDGLRGSVHLARGHARDEGQLAVTFVDVVEELRTATVCKVRLQTGRTHQIRIHLAEQGHPLVGETVYVRDYLRRGAKPIACDRLLLHAGTLGFDHPVTGKRLDFDVPPPPEFERAVAALRKR